MNKETQEEDQEFEEPQRPVDPPQEKNPHKRKPAWAQEIIQGADVDVIVTSECIHLYFLSIVTRCLFQDVLVSFHAPMLLSIL